MDKDLINIKLEALARCVARIESQNINDENEVEQNLDKQEIIVLNLQRAVQICVDVANHVLLDYEKETPASMAEAFVKLSKNGIISEELAQELARAVGFRNIAVHQYENINYKIVFAVVKNHLNCFKDFSKAVLALPTS